MNFYFTIYFPALVTTKSKSGGCASVQQSAQLTKGNISKEISIFLTSEFIASTCPYYDCGCGMDCQVCTPVACGCQIMENLPMCEYFVFKSYRQNNNVK
jgi:hypothetical protein